MSASHQPDPLSLIAGPELPPRPYRCPDCRTIDHYADRLPTGGATCRICAGAIRSGDAVEYAQLRTRIVALVMDASVVGTASLIALLLVAFLELAFGPRDEHGELTDEALFWSGVVSVAVILVVSTAYLFVGNARGKTPGKSATGLVAVNAATGKLPGVGGSLNRTAGQLFTILTLGLGYALAIRDPRRQTLHDRIANTIVIET